MSANVLISPSDANGLKFSVIRCSSRQMKDQWPFLKYMQMGKKIHGRNSLKYMVLLNGIIDYLVVTSVDWLDSLDADVTVFNN